MKKSLILMFIILTAFLSYGQNTHKLPFGSVTVDEVARRAFDKDIDALRVSIIGGITFSGTVTSDSNATHWSNLLLAYILAKHDTSGNYLLGQILAKSINDTTGNYARSVTNAKLDSLLTYSRAEAILTVNGDTVGSGNNSYAHSVNCLGAFPQGYSFTITADDTIEVSSTSAFTTGTVFPLRPNATSTVWSYTSPYLKATSFSFIYYRRKGTSGIPLVDFIAWGK